ncbi:MAG: putative lipopolysaccharide heptosyltransferase III [Candidatus Nitricoxidivorans perseverans]|uniref:Lipopolysaccharide heptosyltransferase III n=1 Tax=Candidatus Nitricoxidivorans perseverans TaxID=2975601 RepID=A0AA49FJ62_9PROT|nr:MAG: putative lipopolysaccharide heptosyltransferase III [Candidatus Nitricoxidivorans perseverans]
MVPDAVPFEKLSRALVVKLRHHGDVLLASPVFNALKRAAPRCEIDALVYAETTPMLEGHPAIAQIHAIDRDWKRQGFLAQARAEWRLLSALRTRRYDLIVHLTEHRRGAWLARLTGARWAVAPRQAGRFWQGSFSHFYPRASNSLRHTVESNLDALRRLGLVIRPDGKSLTLVAGAKDERAVEALMAERGLEFNEFIQIHPTSRWLFKTWPAERVAALIDRLAGGGWKIALTAAPDAKEMAFIDAVLKSCRAPVVNLAGRLSLKELTVLSAHARLFVGVDSAPMHIAAAVDTPVVGIFGPSGDVEWRPWGVAHRVVASEFHPCRPCGLDGCGGGKVSECLTALPVDRVLAACEELLA